MWETNTKKALIAMSGGVDSSVAAFFTIKEGYECIGAMMRLNEKEADAPDDSRDAYNVCQKLGIPFHIFDFKEDFRLNVINKFIRSYECGLTPNPCIECNKYLKFGKFFDSAQALGCDLIVTGHYARICFKDGRYILKKASDSSKDQSYVLYSLTQNQLAHTYFPLGEITKSDARKIAEENGFVNAKKQDSQDICFVPDGNYAEIIEKYTNKTYPEGNFVNREGSVLGKHKGIIRYTVGQRRGLGLALKEPMYVMEKRIKENEVVLCKNSELFSTLVTANDFNWIAFEKPDKSFKANAKIRYNQSEQSATVTPNSDGTVTVEFDRPQRAAAKGQALVLYDGDCVIGGGTII